MPNTTKRPTWLICLEDLLSFLSKPHVWLTIILLLVLWSGMLHFDQVLQVIRAVANMLPDLNL